MRRRKGEVDGSDGERKRVEDRWERSREERKGENAVRMRREELIKERRLAARERLVDRRRKEKERRSEKKEREKGGRMRRGEAKQYTQNVTDFLTIYISKP